MPPTFGRKRQSDRTCTYDDNVSFHASACLVSVPVQALRKIMTNYACAKISRMIFCRNWKME